MVGIVVVWAVLIPVAVIMIATQPAVPTWAQPLILFAWWPVAFAIAWKVAP